MIESMMLARPRAREMVSLTDTRIQLARTTYENFKAYTCT
jgi:hypothetical protein